MTPDPWLGPDAGEVIEALAVKHHRNVVIAPIGFTCEHVEVLYDVDVEFRQKAAALEMRLERTEMVGSAPEMMTGLAGLVRERAKGCDWL
jgi:ferrochelatase